MQYYMNLIQYTEKGVYQKKTQNNSPKLSKYKSMIPIPT